MVLLLGGYISFRAVRVQGHRLTVNTESTTKLKLEKAIVTVDMGNHSRKQCKSKCSRKWNIYSAHSDITLLIRNRNTMGEPSSVGKSNHTFTMMKYL